MIINRIPLTVEITGKYFENFLSLIVSESIASAVDIKGTASPKE